jgi:NEDD8-activating enzyme E1
MSSVSRLLSSSRLLSYQAYKLIMACLDMDTIDLSNLNRQFLFRQKDIGRSKAEVAAEFIHNRIPGCNITAYVGRIQDKDEAFYRRFKLIISGLDNIEARRWLNSFIVSMVTFDSDGEIDPDSIIPIIDGGTEGFKGQARVILPRITSCFECSIESFPPQQNFPMCTIAETPRLPEHCIAYAYTMEWERTFGDKKLDKDNPEHMTWVYERALQRANTFGIEGVTYFKTLGVVKNIIPAVASTNAIISACCVNEALKLLTYCSQTMNTYYMYMGSQEIYTTTFEYGRNESCLVCSDSSKARLISVSGMITLADLISKLSEDPVYQLKKPSLVSSNASLYMQKPPALEQATRGNLSKCLNQLMSSGEILTITDPMLTDVSLSIQIDFSD